MRTERLRATTVDRCQKVDVAGEVKGRREKRGRKFEFTLLHYLFLSGFLCLFQDERLFDTPISHCSGDSGNCSHLTTV